MTPRQHDLLVFLTAYAEAKGYPPSFTEMRKAMNHKSKSSTHGMIVKLERQGKIKRLPFTSRAIEVLTPAYPKDTSKRCPLCGRDG